MVPPGVAQIQICKGFCRLTLLNLYMCKMCNNLFLWARVTKFHHLHYEFGTSSFVILPICFRERPTGWYQTYYFDFVRQRGSWKKHSSMPVGNGIDEGKKGIYIFKTTNDT